MQFWRIINNKIKKAYDVKKLGFNINNPDYIPEQYIKKGNFIINRMCTGLGDWGIISAMPRKLKEKYNCDVYLPSPDLLQKIFPNKFINTFKNNWNKPLKNAEIIFKNNPYVDGYVDSYNGEIFHDHFRIYDPKVNYEPLVKQMLRYWRFDEDKLNNKDLQPEIYFTKEEKEKGQYIINEYFSNNDYGTLLLPNSYNYKEKNNRKLLNVLKKYKNLKFAYYTGKNIKNTKFNFIKKGLNLRHIDIRLQLYIKTKAKVNIGYQSGVNDIIPRYSKVITLPKDDNIGSNYIHGQKYIGINYNE